MKDSLQEIRYMHWSLIKMVKSCADSTRFKFDVGLCLYALNTNKVTYSDFKYKLRIV